ncbi:MAG: sulfur carrier protein ThiS [Cetobacterium sp.]|uniref:sulfur carrier protein ThiS n=1 Tax=Cetobacterium sp. TaxID=2071632 RepID=UPI002FC982BE
MKIILNGDPHEVKNGTTIFELLKLFEVSEDGVIVLIEEEIIPKEEYTKEIYNDCEIEFLRFVSGG